ncbi:hypothetical protein GCM10023321_28730 [Pseudonocardia eucalypti]|uniref:RNA polymerase sigma-70 factor (ECF subfamily) n=2 Tax=Pseudonocardia eucalypti TaxID=648755 RepID=A0ABP9Q672_9PSEU|nr:RNA polymerase sigma-70 factor (ECF subfamily) [Pseudonocardia eucalypti]
MDPATQRMDQRGTRAPGPNGGRPGYQVPVLPRPRPDEVPPPPIGNAPANPPARPPATGDHPRVAEPRSAPVQSQATPVVPPLSPEDPAAKDREDDDYESDMLEAGEAAGGSGADSNGLAGWDLVRATQAGDQQAFGQLYDRYHEMVFRYVLFRVSDRQLAEDLTAETFLRALRRINSVSYQGRDIGAWFVTIARNLVLDHVKSSRYRLEQTTSEIADLSPSTSGPEQQVLNGATYEELLRCVAKLNSDQKECIALRFLQGLSVAETARLMGRNEGAVKALQHRAVRRLAQLLPEGLR